MNVCTEKPQNGAPSPYLWRPLERMPPLRRACRQVHGANTGWVTPGCEGEQQPMFHTPPLLQTAAHRKAGGGGRVLQSNMSDVEKL